MTVHVRRGGKWIDAPFYEEGDEILVGENMTGVVKSILSVADIQPVEMEVILQGPPRVCEVKLKVGDEITTKDVSSRISLVARMMCPDCGSKLEFVPARTMHPDYAENDLARKCTAEHCKFMCFVGDVRSESDG